MTDKVERPSARDFAVSREQPVIQRYTPNERSNHWVTAITFVLLAWMDVARARSRGRSA